MIFGRRQLALKKNTVSSLSDQEIDSPLTASRSEAETRLNSLSDVVASKKMACLMLSILQTEIGHKLH